jgi:hypothetical protein
MGFSGAVGGLFSRFQRGVITTYALEVGATGDRHYRNHTFSAFRAVCCLIHEILPIFPSYSSVAPRCAGPNSPFSFYCEIHKAPREALGPPRVLSSGDLRRRADIKN